MKAKVYERDMEIETWRSMYMKVVNAIKNTNWSIDFSVKSLKEIASEYDKIPRRINFSASKGAVKRLRKKIKKEKEGAVKFTVT